MIDIPLLLVALVLSYWIGHRLGFADGRDKGRLELAEFFDTAVKEHNARIAAMHTRATELHGKAEKLRERATWN